MKATAINTNVVEGAVTFAGMLGGIAFLVAALLMPEWRALAVPGLAMLLPSLVYGLR